MRHPPSSERQEELADPVSKKNIVRAPAKNVRLIETNPIWNRLTVPVMNNSRIQ
ncbi:MAG: hypothetical protein WCF90_02275 [Methanomicrobiales archaeon]